MGISEVEFLGPDDEAEPEPDANASADADADADSPVGSTSSARSATPTRSDTAAESDREALGSEPPRRRVQLPGLALRRRIRANAWITPVTTLLVVLVLAVAGGAYAVVRHQDRTSDDFDLTLISAQYTLRQDASGIDLAMAVQNMGSTMIELTGVSIYQPGLIRFTQAEEAPGVTEFEVGSPQQSAFGLGTAINPVAISPRDVEMVTVPFRYDCSTRTEPAVTHTVGITGFSSRGNSRTVQLALPLDATPWQSRDALRTALCDQPSPQSDLKVGYGGYGDTMVGLTPVHFNYSLTLTAPPSTVVTVSSISQDNPGISATTDPPVPVTVLDGQTVRLTVTWRVMSCVIATSVHSAPGVEITALANQTTQTWDAKLGAQFTKDLDAEISTVCSGG
ncbi:MAG TPA: hypothetical protein VFU74_14400 [Actinocrinis sp.]|nr:hypothetical protein [Actinocrinis sp.]